MTEAVPHEFWQGVEQFNSRQFYACHDTLEALWMEATEPQKTFYQGILQIAVALHHLGNSNWRGAVILLGEGINRLQRYPPAYAGIDVDDLLTSSAVMLTALQQAGPEKVSDWSNAGAMPSNESSLPRIISVGKVN
jgi:predicted metal-dependent hydrolase